MSDTTENPGDDFEPIADVPIRSVNIYARLWQLETWLRTMVYVELRALLGDDWAKELDSNSSSMRADKSLTHMPTAEMNALSYSPLSKLLKLVDEHWDCFGSYLPPQALWTVKLQEIAQIRHRAAHFRVGHSDDLRRLKQFLRDIDKGFWRFCTSYNDVDPILPPSSDPVTAHFLPLDPLPWGEVGEDQWALFGIRDKSIPVGLNVSGTRRPWAAGPFVAGTSGYLYNFNMYAQNRRGFNMSRLLERTRHLHPHLVHLCLGSDMASVRLTVPSLLGADAIIAVIEAFHDAAMKELWPRNDIPDPVAMNELAGAWPEYVLGPDNPLTFLAPEMECSFFGA